MCTDNAHSNVIANRSTNPDMQFRLIHKLHEIYHKYKPKTLHFPASVLTAAMVRGFMFSGCLNLILVQVISQSLEEFSSDLEQNVSTCTQR